MRYAFLAGIILLLFSCKKAPEMMMPQGLAKDSIIPRYEMVRILADMHIMEAVLQYQRTRQGKVTDPVSARYDQLFSEYKMSQKRFRLNVAYYQSDPEGFQKMYDDVIKEIEKRKKLLRFQ